MVKFERRLTTPAGKSWNNSRLTIYIVIAVILLLAILQFSWPKKGEPTKNTRPPRGIGVHPEKPDSPKDPPAAQVNR